jgi:putative transposase
VHHYDAPNHAHLLTFSCYQRMPLLTNDTWRTLLSEGINRSLKKQNWNLIAFVYMPEHLHLLVFPKEENYRVDALLFAIKRPFSYRIKIALQTTRSRLLKRLTIQDRPGHLCFRFWQEGPGHDRNLISSEKCIRAAEYLHNNPVRRKLCESPDQWRWSSWKFYHQPEVYTKDAALPQVHGFPG